LNASVPVENTLIYFSAEAEMTHIQQEAVALSKELSSINQKLSTVKSLFCVFSVLEL
jgi:hypothetical protein